MAAVGLMLLVCAGARHPAGATDLDLTHAIARSRYARSPHAMCSSSPVYDQAPYGCTRVNFAAVKDMGGCCRACDAAPWGCRHWWWQEDVGQCILFARCVGNMPLKGHVTGFRRPFRCNSTGPLWQQPPTAGATALAGVEPGPVPKECRRLDRSMVTTPRKDPPCGGVCSSSSCGCLPPQGAMPLDRSSGWWVFGSQTREDAAIYYRYFCGLCSGVFVEMGAVDGLYCSNSLFFERALGWRGVLIEANPENYRELRVNRPLSKTLGMAACPAGGRKHIEFVPQGPVGGDIAVASPRIMEKYWRKNWRQKVVKVPCAPLGQILREQGVTFVDFFSLDVEGSEAQVLRSMDWTIPVRVWLVEMGDNMTQNQNIRDILFANGYRHAPRHWSTTRFCERDALKIADRSGIVRRHPACANNEVFENKKYVAEQRY
eukprot:Hpha_TRINITY_DN17521_c0_g1::TRINITY_DN17521_c0_g1_i1::g.92581::m.92581